MLALRQIRNFPKILKIANITCQRQKQQVFLLQQRIVQQRSTYNSRNLLAASLVRTMATAGDADSSSGFKFTELEGDLFSAPSTHSLAHCVAADFGMGAGIAVKFKQIYGKVDELLAQCVHTGGVAVLKDNERYIYYLVTKPLSWDKPTYDTLRASLQAMREHMCANNVNKLALPRIGCGIDGLEWDKVGAELKDVFGKDNLEILIYNFVPK